MANSKIIQSIHPLEDVLELTPLWTNPAYGLSPEVDLVSTWEEAKAYVSLIY